MYIKPLLSLIFAVALVGCGGSVATNFVGSASLAGDAFVGQMLTASITDADGVQSDTVSYAWFRNGSGGDRIDGVADSSYTLTTADIGSEITVVIRYIDNRGFHETDESERTATVQDVFNLGATFIYGLVDASTCNIFSVDEAGLASATAAATGMTVGGIVDFGSQVQLNGTSLIECTGGTYTDEASGNTLTAPITRAVVMVDEDSSFTVSPLTEIAVQLAMSAGGDLNRALTTYNSSVAFAFGLRDGIETIDITEVAPTDLFTTPASDDDAGTYATVLALLSQLAVDSANTVTTIIANFSNDLADGRFSTETIDVLLDALDSLRANTATVATNNVSSTALDEIEDVFNNAPEPATFDNLNATIASDADEGLTGIITIIDPNVGEALIVAETVTSTYGTFTITADGSWTYVVDTTDATVAVLAVGESVNDIIPIVSVDGSTANLIIRIVALTQVAEITNMIVGDTGELRLNIDDHQLAGRLTFSFLKTEALGSDGNQKDAYITLYGSSGSASESLVDLRIQGEAMESDGTIRAPRFLVRNTDNASYPGDMITAPFNSGEWYDVEITWDMAQANQITIRINGEVLGGGAFSTAAVVDTDFIDLDQWFAEGVQRVQWRFGDNGSTVPFGSYLVDDIVIYSDVAGTTVVFEDDFEGNDVGDSLNAPPYAVDSVNAEVAIFDGLVGGPVAAVFFDLTAVISSDDSNVLTGTVSVLDANEGEDLIVAQPDTATLYGTFNIMQNGAWEYTLNVNNATITALVFGDRITDTVPIESIDRTAAALVITINGVGGVAPGANNVAVITDTDGGDTGELRYALGANGPLAAGRLTARVQRSDDNLGDGDAFINLYNSATNNDGAILDLRIRDDNFGIRSPSGVDLSSLSVILDAFMDVVITWEYPSGDLTLLPEVTVEIDDVSVGPFTPANNSVGGVTHIAFRLGDNSRIIPDTGRFLVDDVFIFSDTAGTTEVFSDDFEGYLDGDSLDTDNAASPYHSNTSEAVVETL